MITLLRASYQDIERVAEYAGLSTDNKTDPSYFVELKNGDVFKEIDTGNVYKYNGATSQWVLQPASGGGGSGDTGVASFNGRTGAVVPVATDYPPSLIGAVNKAGDTMTGDLDMGGHTVTGISDALEATDALPKGQADDIYVNATGDTMTGNLDMSGNQIRGVLSIVANGSTGNAGVQFASNGNFTNIVCGVSTSASFSANAVDFYNHNLDRVNSINMTSESTIEDANYIGGNVEENNRTAIDFTTENAVGIWAQGTKQVNIDANGVDVNGNKITGVNAIVAEGSTVDNIMFESDGAIVGILCEGTRSATFTANAIDAYNHTITRVGTPTQPTDAARKQDVDAVQTAVDTVSETVNGIIDGTEAIPYLPEDGGTLTGPLNMGNNKITMGGTPTETTDVTNKGYVDGVVGVVSAEVDKILDGTSPVAIPAATTTHLGGIIVGEGLSVETDGTLSVVQAQSATPIASATELGCVKVGTGLFIENDGTLEATAGLYGDPACNVMFVGPSESKTIRLTKGYQVLYGVEYGVSSTTLDPNWGGPFYVNAGQSTTIGNLTLSFDTNGAEFTLTNAHTSVAYFFMYAGYGNVVEA